jgi:hypothetical protein
MPNAAREVRALVCLPLVTHRLHEDIQCSQNTGSLIVWDRREELVELDLTCRGELVPRTPAGRSELELLGAPVNRTRPSFHPAARLKMPDQPADRALVQPQLIGKLLLRWRLHVGEHRKRVRFGDGHGLPARRLVWSVQAEGADERNHLLLEHRCGDGWRAIIEHSCIIQRSSHPVKDPAHTKETWGWYQPRNPGRRPYIAVSTAGLR